MKSTAIRWTKKFSQKEAGAKEIVCNDNNTKKKLFALTKCPPPPSRKIMVRPLY